MNGPRAPWWVTPRGTLGERLAACEPLAAGSIPACSIGPEEPAIRPWAQIDESTPRPVKGEHRRLE